jgi:two-component system, OmpR family, copper resistance phosphate regulon response regulator CusR
MRLLVAEADASLAEFLRSSLQQEHFRVQLISTGGEFSGLSEKPAFDLLLLDSNLSGTNGLDTLERSRHRWPELPVILLSSGTTSEERVRGLNAGADDVVTKPFAVNELVARVHALLRRRARPSHDALLFEDLEVNRVSHSVSRGGRAIELSPKEYALLEFLLRHSGRPVSRPAIIEQVWHMHSNAITNVVDVYINYLRRKIDAGSDKPLIHTIRGVGYQIGASNGHI